MTPEQKKRIPNEQTITYTAMKVQHRGVNTNELRVVEQTVC
jgi:hypothetical protein